MAHDLFPQKMHNTCFAIEENYRHGITDYDFSSNLDPDREFRLARVKTCPQPVFPGMCSPSG